MKKTAGYTVDFANNTITLTKTFAQRAKNPSSAEFRELAKLHKNFPDFTITMRTAVITADKNVHDGLSVDFMTDYIELVVADEKAIAEFEEVKAYYKKSNGYYGKVKSWFLKHYKKYQEVDFAEIVARKEAKAKAEAQAPATEENADLRIAG